MKLVATIVAIIAALLYIISPWDLLPDFLAGFGWLDDLVILGFLVRYLLRKSRDQQREQPRGSQDQTHSNHTEDQGSAGSGSEAYDPYRILEVDRNASPEEIKKAYRRLVNRYHPDKVAHLGDEFREMAENRFKEIQRAYNDLK
jgi:DnaJ like chaperone protein